MAKNQGKGNLATENLVTFWYKVVQNSKARGNTNWQLLFKLGKLIVNVVYPICAKNNLRCGIDDASNIIVSLTSYPERINTVYLTICTLLEQSYRPKKVILWLANEQFPTRKVPNKLQKLEQYGLEIRYCDDLKSHKKYFYTMKEYPGNIVVTADDDMFYPNDFLESLNQCHLEYPNTIVCHWSHEIEYGEDRAVLPYGMWENGYYKEPSYRTLPIGCNGILYPTDSLDKEVFDKDVINRYTLTTDDLWLKCMAVKNGRKAVNCDITPVIYFNNVRNQQGGLWKKNTSGVNGTNDIVWNNLMHLYPEVESKIREGSEI